MQPSKIKAICLSLCHGLCRGFSPKDINTAGVGNSAGAFRHRLRHNCQATSRQAAADSAVIEATALTQPSSKLAANNIGSHSGTHQAPPEPASTQKTMEPMAAQAQVPSEAFAAPAGKHEAEQSSAISSSSSNAAVCATEHPADSRSAAGEQHSQQQAAADSAVIAATALTQPSNKLATDNIASHSGTHQEPPEPASTHKTLEPMAVQVQVPSEAFAMPAGKHQAKQSSISSSSSSSDSSAEACATEHQADSTSSKPAKGQGQDRSKHPVASRSTASQPEKLGLTPTTIFSESTIWFGDIPLIKRSDQGVPWNGTEPARDS